MKTKPIVNAQKDLEFLQAQNEAAYQNICYTIHCARLMQLAQNAEKAFFARNTADFNCYDFSEENAAHFEKAYNLFANAKTYLYTPKNKSDYFVVFCVDRKGIVRFKHVYEAKDCMETLLKSFKDEFRLCVPMWHIDESVAAYFSYLGQEAPV